MLNLRCITKDDLPQINLVLSKSFTHANIKSGDTFSRTPLCRIDFLEMYLAANPGNSFVIEKDRKVIAYCFTRLWGTVGWIGPLSVLPSEQGQGYGKQIVCAVIETLKANGAITIGLETSAHSHKNLAFYTKLGFEAGQPVVDVISKVPSKSYDSIPADYKVVKYSELSLEEQKSFLKESSIFSSQFEPGLDYANEIQISWQFGFGDACLIRESDTVIGFILAHTERYSQEEKRRFIKVNALQMLPGRPIICLNIFLEIIRKWALREKLPGIYLRIPARYHKGFASILTKAFTVVQNDLRMTLKGFPQKDDPEFINFSKWE